MARKIVIGLLSAALGFTAVFIALRLLQRPDVSETLPGPKNQLSQRSKREIEVILSETPYVLGAWVSKVHYGKTENPIIFYWTNEPVLVGLVKNIADTQASGRGYSSAERDADPKLLLRNSVEARTGLIKCSSIAGALLDLTPAITRYVKSICRATIPPFAPNPNLDIVLFIDIDVSKPSPEQQLIFRKLLQLQLDIYNRDYKGREIWVQ